MVVFGAESRDCVAFEAFGPVNETASAIEHIGDARRQAFDKSDGGVEAGKGWRQRDGDCAVLGFCT